jgi:hypothetical protein
MDQTPGEKLKMARDAFTAANAAPDRLTDVGRQNAGTSFRAYQDASRNCRGLIAENIQAGKPAIVTLVDEFGKESKVTVGTLGAFTTSVSINYSPDVGDEFVNCSLPLMDIKSVSPS